MHMLRLLPLYFTALTTVLGLPAETPGGGNYISADGWKEIKRIYDGWRLDPKEPVLLRTRPNLNLSPDEYQNRHRQNSDQVMDLEPEQRAEFIKCLEIITKWPIELPARDDPLRLEFRELCLKRVIGEKRVPEGQERSATVLWQQEQQQQQTQEEARKDNINPFSNTVIEGISRNLARMGVGRMDHPTSTITTPAGFNGLSGRLKNLQLGVGGGILPMRGLTVP